MMINLRFVIETVRRSVATVPISCSPGTSIDSTCGAEDDVAAGLGLLLFP
jgi:hypothetical protein